MFVAITNTPRDYAWGSATALPELLGTPVTGEPQAELWLGTHPGSPARTSDGLLSDVVTLPFLLKVLAAASPLSLQAHPTMSQAAEGFARENALGVPLTSPSRNYKDELHKPELIFALTPLRALCGFRAAAEARADLELLGLGEWAARLRGDGDIRPVFEWLISGGPEVSALIDSLVVAAARVAGPRFDLVAELAAAYPGDPGIAISLMLNLVTLAPGEVLFLPAGNIHAYIEGTGIELMAASDNVLRGGLTPKHVDVGELLRVLDFTPCPVPYLAPTLDGGAAHFDPGAGFELVAVSGDASVALESDAIVLCTAGSFALTGRAGAASVARGEALYVSGDEGTLAVVGAGQVFVAAPRR